MSTALDTLVEAARKTKMTQSEKEAQRLSFAYGNTRIENDRITRETIKKQAAALAESSRTSAE